jgi:hypothetical protein
LFLHLVSFSLQCHVCVLLYCVLTVLCQVALTTLLKHGRIPGFNIENHLFRIVLAN